MFYDFKIEIFEETTVKDKIGKRIPKLDFKFTIKCDIQPSTENLIRKTFGKDVDSIFTIFCDEDLKIGTIIAYNNKYYRINSKADWITYRIYSVVDEGGKFID